MQLTEELIDKDYIAVEDKIKDKERALGSKTRLGYSINISLSIIDLELLENIKNNLNDIGTIYVYPNRKEARLAIWKKDEVRWLVENVFDKHPLITTHQKNRYAKLRFGLLNNITLFHSLQELAEFKKYNHLFVAPVSTLPSLYLDNWILGIINSEGCFYTRTKKDGSNLLVFLPFPCPPQAVGQKKGS